MADSNASSVFPNDVVLLLKRSPDDLDECPEMEHGTGDSDTVTSISSATKLVLASPIPGTIDFAGASVDEMLKTLKCGYNNNEDAESNWEKPYISIPVSQCQDSQFKSSRVELDKVKVIDRPIQLCSWIKYKNEIGFVLDINTKVDVHAYENDVYIADVEEDQVELIPEFFRGLYVFFRGWIGVVTNVKQKIHLKYLDETECYLTRSFNNGLYFQKLCNYIHCGEELSPSGNEIKDAEWVDGKEPGMIKWFFLRYLNIGYSEGTTAQVIGNEILSVTVNWHSQINPGHPPVMMPSSEIRQEELKYLSKLTLPKKFVLGRGTSVRVQLNDSTEVLHESQWFEKLIKRDLTNVTSLYSDENGLKENQLASSGNRTDEVVVPTDETVKLVEGKVFLRHATASVLWKDGTLSQIPVQQLIPYYPPEGKNYPVAPGTEVRKTCLDTHKGFVQTSHSDDGYVQVNWFGESSGDIPEVMQLNKETVELITNLNVASSKQLSIGLIVICLKTSEPGVCVGTNLSGKILVKIRKEIKELERNDVKVFSKLAVFLNGELSWVPFKDNPSFPNEKHISCFDRLALSPETLSFPTTMPRSLKQFEILPKAPATHYGLKRKIPFKYVQPFSEAIERDIKILDQNAMPEGIWVKCYTNSPNLFSVLLAGMPGSSFQGGLFHLEVVLPQDYPNELPIVVLISDADESLKMDIRNIDEDGLLDMVSIFHGFSKSNMDLAFVIEHIRESVFGDKNDDDDNEPDEYTFSQEINQHLKKQCTIAIIIPNITNWLAKTPKQWENEVLHHYRFEVPRFVFCMKKWIEYSYMTYQLDWEGTDESETQRRQDDTKYPSFLPFDTVMQAEIRKNLEELSHIYNLIY